MRDDPTLASAAYRYFGGWYQALEACGIDPGEWWKRPVWAHIKRRARSATATSPRSRATNILESILERRRAGLSLHAANVLAEDREMLMTANRFFGT